MGPKIFAASSGLRALFCGEGLFFGRRALRSDEECLCNGVETFVVAYPKVGKGLRSGIGCYAAADQKDRPKKIHAC